jgi:hypothetical protein
LELLDEIDTVDRHSPRFVIRHRRDYVAQSVNGVTSSERARGVRSSTHHFDRHSKRSLTASFDTTVGGLSENRGVRVQQLGAKLTDLYETRLASSDLLTRVKDPRNFNGTLRRVRCQLEHYCERTLHVTRAETSQFVIHNRGRTGVARHRVQVTRDQQSRRMMTRSSRDNIVTDALHIEVGITLQDSRNVVRQCRLTTAH